VETVSRPEVPPAVLLAGLLAEPDRLQAFAAIVLGATTVDAVAERAGLDRRRAIAALERLAAGGLVVEAPAGEGGGLRVAGERFKEAARAAGEAKRAEEDASSADAFAGRTPEEVAVLRNFVSGGRLTRIPAQKSKRLVVLDWLASRFEPGRVYPERDVNFLLGLVHHDVAALRRYLVDEELLERRDQFYWRAGGTFDVDAGAP
jgi:hypothetical protein